MEAAGADPEQVWQEATACKTADECSGVSCTPFDTRSDWDFTAVTTNDGACELVPCDDGTCDGSPCDPVVGCGERFGCDAPSCDEPGICRPLPDADCTDNYNPVCGCNGVTYGNSCNALGNAIDYEGECVAAE